MASDTIEQFVDSLIAEAGLGGDDERSQEYRDRVTALVNEFLGIEMMKWLSPEDTEALLDQISDDTEPTPEMLRGFLAERVEHLEDKLATALMSFKQDFLANLESTEGII